MELSVELFIILPVHTNMWASLMTTPVGSNEEVTVFSRLPLKQRIADLSKQNDNYVRIHPIT